VQLPAIKDDGDGSLPDQVRPFFAHYTTLVRTAVMLLQLPQLNTLMRRFEAIEEEFMPGGPPMSPVYDSYHTVHVVCDDALGAAAETPASIIARLTAGDPTRAAFHALASAMHASHLDLYEALRAEGTSATLEHVRNGTRIDVLLSGPFLRTGDLLLGRVLPFSGALYMIESPYLLRAGRKTWLEYFARVEERFAARARASGNAASTPSASVKPKQKKGKGAKPKRKSKPGSANASSTKFSPLDRHLKFGDTWRFWLDFIMDAYSGERNGIVYLSGVPDRPETLPQHEDFDGQAADGEALQGLPEEKRPLAALRMALDRLGHELGYFDMAHDTWLRAAQEFDIDPKLTENEAPLFFAYTVFGQRDEERLSVLDHHCRNEIPAEQRAEAEAIQRGWFSLFQVERVELDRALIVKDTLRRKKLEISERLATRSVGVGDVLAGWVTVDAHGTYRLEGALILVPHWHAAELIAESLDMRDELGSVFRELSATQRLGLLPLATIATARVFQAQAPDLVNTSGHELLSSQGRFTVRDVQSVRRTLRQHFDALDNENGDEDEYDWLSPDDVLLAHLQLRGDTLLVSTNSQERLAQVKKRLLELCGEELQARLDSYEGARATPAREFHDPQGPIELPDEAKEAIAQQLTGRVMAMLDQPIEMFRGKTLRQLARGKRSRADAINWLREQERLFRSNPQLDRLDMRPIWAELGLEYQGLESDDSR